MIYPYATFVIAPSSKDGRLYAGVTRPSLAGVYGLPGGKVDPSDIGLTLTDTIVSATLREAKEEGWELHKVDPTIIYDIVLSGKRYVWITAQYATLLSEYKEQDRIKALPLPASKLIPHYNNKAAFKSYYNTRLLR